MACEYLSWGCSPWPRDHSEWTQGRSLSPPSVVSLGEHLELPRSLLPPLIIHTAATPMSLPKSSSTGLAEALGPASRRTSSSGSGEPGTAQEMKSPVGVACRGPKVGGVLTSGEERGQGWAGPRGQLLSHGLDKPRVVSRAGKAGR